MRSIFKDMKLLKLQLSTDFRELRQYCTCTGADRSHSYSNRLPIIFSESAKHFLSNAANDLEPKPRTHSLMANNQLPPTGFFDIFKHDGRQAQAAELRQTEKKGAAGGRTPSNRGRTAFENADVGTVFGREPSQLVTPMKSEGRREWNKDNDEHCLYGNF